MVSTYRMTRVMRSTYLSSDSSTDWYEDSASGVAASIESRSVDTDWYEDSASGVANSLSQRRRRKRNSDTDWYESSAQGIADSLSKRITRRKGDRVADEDTDWYEDSAQGVAASLASIKRSEDAKTDWYEDSAEGVAASIAGRKRAEDAKTDWYEDSAEGVAASLAGRRRKENAKTDWYEDSAEGVAASLASRRRSEDAKTDWYEDSASGIADSLGKRTPHTMNDGDEDEDTDWYEDSASGVASSLNKRAMTNAEKETYEVKLRRWIYWNMRGKPLREVAERGKAFFEFTPKPRDDFVDRWHVPAELRERYNSLSLDAERVNLLNFYLMVTAREPKSAQELGFVPTAPEPIVVEGNQVGYGYIYAGQHQEHCADFVADAIDIGKDNLNDFFLKHTIHCLALLKYLSPQLTMKQPLPILKPLADHRVEIDYPQTIEGELKFGPI
jgi:hypothetical protein